MDVKSNHHKNIFNLWDNEQNIIVVVISNFSNSEHSVIHSQFQIHLNESWKHSKRTALCWMLKAQLTAKHLNLIPIYDYEPDTFALFEKAKLKFLMLAVSLHFNLKCVFSRWSVPKIWEEIKIPVKELR